MSHKSKYNDMYRLLKAYIGHGLSLAPTLSQPISFESRMSQTESNIAIVGKVGSLAAMLQRNASTLPVSSACY